MAFDQLCTHMEPDCFQLEFDLRLHLTHREASTSAPGAVAEQLRPPRTRAGHPAGCSSR